MLLYISLFTIVLSLILIIYNWNSNRNSVFLALFFILMSLYGIVHYLTLYGKSVFWLALLYNHISSFLLLLGPLLFFYTRGTLNDKQGLRKRDWFHFVPFTIHLIGNIPYFLKPFSYKEQIASAIINNIDTLNDFKINIFFSVPMNFVLRPALMLIYAVYSIGLLYKHSPYKNKNIPSKQVTITYRWLILLNSFVLLLILSFSLVTIDFVNSKASFALAHSYNFHLISGLIFFIMTSSLLIFPQVLYGIPTVQKQKGKKKKRKEIKEIEIKKPVSIANHEEILVLSYQEDSHHKLAEKIKEYLLVEKPYLNQDFDISEISIKLKVPQNQVYYCFNSIFESKFTRIKMQLRVEYAQELLKTGLNANLTIDAIGQKSGFSSRSNFYNAFKEETGCTPTEYLKTHQLPIPD